MDEPHWRDLVLTVPPTVTAEEILAWVETGVLPAGATVAPYEVFAARGRLPDCDCQLIQCVCATKREHDQGCRFRRALTCPIGIACEPHGEDVCPVCDPCTCGVPQEDPGLAALRASRIT